MIAYTLETFQNCELIDEIIISADSDYFELLEKIKKNYKFNKVTKIVEGGKERQNSVSNALFAIDAEDDDLVAVHDAARALVPPKILTNAVKAAKRFDNVVVAINARDTLIKSGNAGIVEGYVDRSEIYYAQTPQIFRYKNLTDAIKKADSDGFIGTDESMIVKKAGYDVRIVEGSSLNFKVTSEADINLFEMISHSL